MPLYKVRIGIDEYECTVDAEDDNEAYRLAFDEMYMNAMPWWDIDKVDDDTEDEILEEEDD